MPTNLAQIIVLAGTVYAGLGLLFALPFAWKGAGRIDPDAASGSWGFRVLIVPGAAAFWPYLALRWIRGSSPPVERGPHRARSARTEGDAA